MTAKLGCDQHRLQQLFEEKLPDDIESNVVEHLATCPRCQQQLESFAASTVWWKDATQRLSKSASTSASLQLPQMPRDSEGHIEPQSRLNLADDGSCPVPQPDQESERDHWPQDDEWHFAYDFAVDFLEPSSESGSLGRLGEYEIHEVIGRGGMGIVLKGFQKELNRFVAVKVLAPHLASSGAARRRFAREAQATAAVVNPHVMAIHSVNTSFKLPYLVMPYIDCQSLQERLDHSGILDLKEILRIGMQAARGLAAAHAQGLVHRDVKPANILLETNVDRVLLTDFGLARAVDDASMTRTGTIAGTPQYMSPEQASGEPIDHRSDLFSLGSVLYALSTGRPPFRAETTLALLRRIRETDPHPIRELNPDLPQWFESLVLQLLEKNPDHRLQSAEQAASLLEQCLAHVQHPTVMQLPTFPNLHQGRRTFNVQLRKKKGVQTQLVIWGVATLIGIAIVVLSGMIVLSSGSNSNQFMHQSSASKNKLPSSDIRATMTQADSPEFATENNENKPDGLQFSNESTGTTKDASDKTSDSLLDWNSPLMSFESLQSQVEMLMEQLKTEMLDSDSIEQNGEVNVQQNESSEVR